MNEWKYQKTKLRTPICLQSTGAFYKICPQVWWVTHPHFSQCHVFAPPSNPQAVQAMGFATEMPSATVAHVLSQSCKSKNYLASQGH